MALNCSKKSKYKIAAYIDNAHTQMSKLIQK